MPGYIKAPDQTYSAIGNALANIPYAINKGRMSEQDKQIKALEFRKSAAEARKISQGNAARSNLARSLETLNRDFAGNTNYSGPPGNMVSRPMTPTDVATAQAALMLSNDDPTKSIGAFRGMNDAYTSRDAVNEVKAGNASMGSQLNAIANQQTIPNQFNLSANGARLGLFDGGVDTGNPMAQSKIGLNVAQAANARAMQSRNSALTENLQDPRYWDKGSRGNKPTTIDQLPQEMQAFFETQVVDKLGTPTMVVDQEKVRSWLDFIARNQNMDQAQQLATFLAQQDGGMVAPGNQAGGLPQMNSTAEAMLLAPNTRFIDPNGVERIRP